MITHTELIAELRKLKIEEVRTDTASFFEFVIRKEIENKLHEILKRHFGFALKPAGENSSKDIERMVERFGGIRKEQVLYSSGKENVSSYVMIWPWNNGLLATVKVVQI